MLCWCEPLEVDIKQPHYNQTRCIDILPIQHTKMHINCTLSQSHNDIAAIVRIPI